MGQNVGKLNDTAAQLDINFDKTLPKTSNQENKEDKIINILKFLNLNLFNAPAGQTVYPRIFHSFIYFPVVPICNIGPLSGFL
jgi:hypothetical protein